uniref:TSA: Wollemia nobilis Ref_Wollemi_Transcript_10235_1472 transcribed RNA sequence n=1 Tax=Wollemia nobilis TaxID=56998 RepID=A0A0C9QTP7_9CONI
MGAGRACLLVLLVFLVGVNLSLAKKEKICDRGWECKGVFCCNKTITEVFTVDQFEALFPKRNTPVAQAVGFWDYKSFILAASLYEGIGFGTTGGQLVQQRELAAFFANIAAETTCGYGVAPGGPLAWGLCYKEEMSPDQIYCQPSLLYPCAPGASYQGRGALPVYWNFNYGIIGEGIKVDLLNHPEFLSDNATLAFQSAIWRWMNPIKPKQPSAHDVIVGNWKPTKNDTASFRKPGFGMVINVLDGGLECGQGDVEKMQTRISHYVHFLDLIGVGEQYSGENLGCGEQVALNPAPKDSSNR